MTISQNWFNEFDYLFENLKDSAVSTKLNVACDIEESEKFILFSFDLPGLSEDEIDVEVKDSVLSIRGERKQESNVESKVKYRGRRFGGFKQSFSLPKTVNQENIEADYTSGVLKVLLPKLEVEPPKKIDVKMNKGSFLNDFLKGKKVS